MRLSLFGVHSEFLSEYRANSRVRLRGRRYRRLAFVLANCQFVASRVSFLILQN